MARTDNLTNFLNDVATAIKSKLDDSTAIPASQFDTKIMSIQTRGNYETRTVNVTSNGSQTITPNQGYDAIESIVINTQVPIPQLQTKSYEFTDNATITLSPETGYDGFSSISLTINVPSGSINNQNKTVTPTTSQQVISADQGYTGLGDVIVNAVTSSIDQNIVAGNIKDGVLILGVTGNYIGPGDTEYATNLALSQQILGGTLPYIPLEYIESTGTQYIDTGIILTAGEVFRTSLDIQYTHTSTGNEIMIGAGGTNTWFGQSAGYYACGSSYKFNIYSTERKNVIANFSDTISVTIDDTTINRSSSTESGNIYILGGYNSRFNSSARLYNFKLAMHNDLELTCDFIPVKRKSDNEICMYDKITGQFFTNAGTDSFIAGPEIN